MIRWLRGLWGKRMQRIDREMLWPSCKRMAPTIEDARGVFFVHMMMDPVYSDMSEDEKIAYCESLT